MPLGKLSRKQIESAYAILSEAQTMVKEGSESDTKFLDASNRYKSNTDICLKAQSVVRLSSVVIRRLLLDPLQLVMAFLFIFLAGVTVLA